MGVPKELRAVTTPGDVAEIYRRATAAKQDPVAYVSHYYWLTEADARKLIETARKEGFIDAERP